MTGDLHSQLDGLLSQDSTYQVQWPLNIQPNVKHFKAGLKKNQNATTFIFTYI